MDSMGRGKNRNTKRKKSVKNEFQASGSSHCMVLLPLTKMDKIRGGNCGRWGGKEVKSLVLAANFECCDASLSRCQVSIGKVRLEIHIWSLQHINCE